MPSLWAGVTSTVGPALLPSACAMVLLGWAYPTARASARVPLVLGLCLGYLVTAAVFAPVPLTPSLLRINGALGLVLWSILLVSWSRGVRDAPPAWAAVGLGLAVGVLVRLGVPAYSGPVLAVLEQSGSALSLALYALGAGLGLGGLVILAGLGRQLPRLGGPLGAVGVVGLGLSALLQLAGFYPKLVEMLLLYYPPVALG